MASAQLNAASNRKGKGMTLSGFRKGLSNKHATILNNPQILVRKNRKGASGSKGSKKSQDCAPAPPTCAPAPETCAPAPETCAAPSNHTETIQGQTTIFNDSWETIGECTRTWQTIKQVETCVDQIECKSVAVDTITNQLVNWQVLTQHQAPRRIIQRIRTCINVLEPKRIEYQTLVAQHVEYQAIGNQNVEIQTLAQKSACVGELANKKVNQRYIQEQKACARTLTAKKVNIKKVKKVNEQVSQLINTDSACLGIRNGASIHSKQSCAPAPETCAAPPKSNHGSQGKGSYHSNH
jgi:hypothetical protein